MKSGLSSNVFPHRSSTLHKAAFVSSMTPFNMNRNTLSRRARALVFVSLAVFLLLALRSHMIPFEWTAQPLFAEKRNNGGQSWSWESIAPSKELKWHRCYDDKFDCARFDVPMNWDNPTGNDRVVLGVVRLKAISSGEMLPPVFINPGGPGGSGVFFMQSAAALIQAIIGTTHDIISFDPRGVGVSTPRVDCWQSSKHRDIWALQAPGNVDERPGLAYQAFARGQAFAHTCERNMNGTNILENLSTAAAARDMLAILEQTGHSKLRYWGFSYGTILGGVFAGMFPDKVDRLVSDGNVDYDDWFNLGYRHFLADADVIIDAFDNTCYKVGPEKCALWAASPRKIQNRRANLLEAIKKSPVLVPAKALGTQPEMPQLITYSRLQQFTRGALYSPIFKMEELARVYATLEMGDGLTFYNLTTQPGPAAAATDTPINIPRETFAEGDAAIAISCSDWLGRDTPESFATYTEELEASSKWFGGLSTFQRLACAGWPTKQNLHVTKKDFKGNTSYPILFVGNMADIITPLQSARNNSAAFPNSVVLVQNSYGHSSLASPSTCTAKYIQSYFLNGTLPARGTICDEDYHIFNFPGVNSLHPDNELSTAILQLTDVWANS